MLNQLQVASVAALQAVKLVDTVEAEAPYVATDGAKCSTLEELFIQSVGDETLAGPSSRWQTLPHIVTGGKYTRAQKKRLNLDSKCRHKGQLASRNMIETMSSMSWHMPGVKTLIVGSASVSGGYANILFRKARAAGAAAAGSAGGGTTAVQPRFSGSTAPLLSSTGLNRVKPLCEVRGPNENVGET